MSLKGHLRRRRQGGAREPMSGFPQDLTRAFGAVSAVEDALSPFGVCIAQTPVTPQKLLELIAGHKGAAAH